MAMPVNKDIREGNKINVIGAVDGVHRTYKVMSVLARTKIVAYNINNEPMYKTKPYTVIVENTDGRKLTFSYEALLQLKATYIN